MLTSPAPTAPSPAPSRYRAARPLRTYTPARRGLPLGFPLPPLTVRPLSPPMSPDVQTKSVEYYRAAQPGSHSIDLERVHPPPVRPTRSPSDPPAIAPLAISKRVKSPPAAIMVPTKPDIVRPARSPARQSGYFDTESPSNGPPGPPPMGPLPPVPDLASPFAGADPMLLRATSAKERRETRRQSKLEDSDIASLERSMRRLSRISLASGTSPGEERTSGPTSPTISLDSHAHSLTPSLRAEKLLRRISRQSDGHSVRLPADYTRVGISGYSVPNSAPVSPGLRGVPPPLLENSELAYLAEKPAPALSVPMRRNVEQSHSAPGAFAPPATNTLGLGLGLTPSDSANTMASTSTSSLSSFSSMSASDTLSTLPSEATIKPTKPTEETQTRATRLNSLSSATTASTTSLLTPVSPPTSLSGLPPSISPSRSPMSPPKPLRLKGSINLRLPPQLRSPNPQLQPPSPMPSQTNTPTRSLSPDIPDLLSQFRDSFAFPARTNEAAYRESTVLPQRESALPRGAEELLVPSRQVSRAPSPALVVPEGAVPPTRIRPGARPRTHSDLVSPEPPAVPPKSPVIKQQALPAVGPKNEPEATYTPRSSSESRVAVEDSGNVLEIPPMRQSMESQVTPRPAKRTAVPLGRSTSQKTSSSGHGSTDRPASPDISYILRTTPRPTRRSSVNSLASSSRSVPRRPAGAAPPSAFRPAPSMPASRPGSIGSSRRSSGVTASSAGFDVEGLGPEVFYGEQYDSEDSDSDLDLATPLPHMMLRAGLLSPRSTIITESMEPPLPPRSSGSGLSARGEALRARGEKVWKAEARRKVRHRDGRNLRDGVGLTTGLGWSDSEDEDAPSPLRRRISSVLQAKAQSRPPSQLSRQSYSSMTMPLSRRSTYSNLDSTSVSSSSQSIPRTPSSHPLSLPHSPAPPVPLSLPLTPGSLPGAAPADEFGKLDFPMPPTATSWRGQPSPGLRKAPSDGMLRSVSGASGSGIVPPSAGMRGRTASTASSAATTSASSQPPSQAQSPRSSASVSARGSIMPPPRSIRVNVRPPTGTRLSAPEALRQAQAAPVLDGSRRLSGA